MKIKTLFLLTATITLAASGCTHRSDNVYPANAAQSIRHTIQRVESGLLPANIIVGEPVKTFTMADRMRYFNVPGVSIAVMKDHKIEWAKSYGVKEAGKIDPVGLNTMFQAASMSKPITSMIALKLEEENKIELKRDINQQLKRWHIPENEYTRQAAVTPELLMLHMGGINVPSFPGYSVSDSIPDVITILNGVPPSNTEAVKVIYAPNTKWSYSGGGYTILQFLMEEVTGLSFAKLMEKYLFDPLKLQHTTFEHNLSVDQQNLIAKGHLEDGKVVVGGYHKYPEKAAAGLWTTPMDYAEMIIELEKSYEGASDKIIRPETSRKMLKKYRGDMALGIVMKNSGDSTALAYGGWNEGYMCDVYSYLESGSGVVIMTNSNNGYMLIQEIYRSLATEYRWPDFKTASVKTVNVPPSVLSGYVGTYQARLEGNKELTFDLVQKSGSLFSVMDNKTYQLYPIGEREFLIPDQDWRFKILDKDKVTDSVEFLVRFESGIARRIK
jgi:CubicO group peptidase (beta-lactamase class C family)